MENGFPRFELHDLQYASGESAKKECKCEKCLKDKENIKENWIQKLIKWFKMKNNYKYYEKGKNVFFIGIIKKFQWVGFMISTDNAIATNEYLLIEFRFLWLRFWFTHDLS